MSVTKTPHVVAMIAAYNEERVLRACLEHYRAQGVDVYLIDNESTDRTRGIAEEFLGDGVIGIENFPRRGKFASAELIARKEELALQIEADWFIHADADEIRLPRPPYPTLPSAFEAVEAAGFNAVTFFEFTFIPTRESPDHDHPEFQRTMRWYYPFSPVFPHRLNAWKRQENRVELAWSGGHVLRFAGLKMAPEWFPMRHYLFLSHDHAMEKFVRRKFDGEEVRRGWYRWRAELTRNDVRLPPSSAMRTYVDDEHLDASQPLAVHLLASPTAVRNGS